MWISLIQIVGRNRARLANSLRVDAMAKLIAKDVVVNQIPFCGSALPMLSKPVIQLVFSCT